jgi:hypothetical protein
MAPTPLQQSLWAKLDERLAYLLRLWAASTDGFTQAEVVVAEQYDPQADNLPIIIVRSYETDTEEAEALFGDGEYHLGGISYPFEIVVANSYSTVALAKAYAQNVVVAVRDVIRKDSRLLSLSGDNGEYVTRMEIGDGEIYVRGLSGAYPEGEYLATCSITFNFYSEV